MAARLYASDGLVARESGPWAEDKLYYLRRYQYAMTTSMNRKWSRLSYVDMMSGPGMCIVPETGKEFEGSALIALRTKRPFDVVVLVEQQEEFAAALRSRVVREGLRPAPTVITADCNDAAVIQQIRHLTSGGLTLAFVDLLGFNVPFSTIERLTRRPAVVDLIITFPEMNFTRNALLAAANEDSRRWTDFVGTDAWRRHVLDWMKKGDRKGESVKWGLMRLYQGQLRTLGYESALVREPMRNRTNAPLYRPLFASRKEAGLKLWRGVSAIDHTGNRDLF